MARRISGKAGAARWQGACLAADDADKQMRVADGGEMLPTMAGLTQ
jgi:hypothetical protein